MPKYEVTYLSKVIVDAKTEEEAADIVQDELEKHEGGAVFSVYEKNKAGCGEGCGCK